MKRYILLLLVLGSVSIGLKGQNLEISTDSGVVANGAIVDVSGDPNSVLIIDLYVKNNGTNTVDVKVRKEVVSEVPGSSNMFCFASQCYGSNDFVSSDSVSIKPGDVDSTFSGDYWAYGVEGVTVVRYTFFNVDNQTDTASVTVRFTGALSTPDIPFIAMSAPYPNPASERVYFDYFPDNSQGIRKVIIRDLTGRIIRESVIPEGQGILEIELTGIESGIHFYSYISSQGVIFTKKLVVKR